MNLLKNVSQENKTSQPLPKRSFFFLFKQRIKKKKQKKMFE